MWGVIIRAIYEFENTNPKGLAYGCGDLLKYYADMTLESAKALEKMNRDRGMKHKIRKYLTEHTGLVGLSLEQIKDFTENWQGVFNYSINGVNICDLIKDKDIKMEVYVDDKFFVAQMLIHKYYKNPLKKNKYENSLDGEQKQWLDWFSKEWEDNYKISNMKPKQIQKELK